MQSIEIMPGQSQFSISNGASCGELFLLFSNISERDCPFLVFPQYTVQFSSVAKSCPTLCNPMDYNSQASLSTTNSGSLLKLMSIESVMSSNHLILCCPLLLLPSIFPSISSQWVSSLHQVAEVLEFQLQHQSFQWIFRTDFLQEGSPCSPRDSQESSPKPQFTSVNFVVWVIPLLAFFALCSHYLDSVLPMGLWGSYRLEQVIDKCLRLVKRKNYQTSARVLGSRLMRIACQWSSLFSKRPVADGLRLLVLTASGSPHQLTQFAKCRVRAWILVLRRVFP